MLSVAYFTGAGEAAQIVQIENFVQGTKRHA